jgi:hypothetical protein
MIGGGGGGGGGAWKPIEPDHVLQNIDPIRDDIAANRTHRRKFPKVEARTRFDKVGLGLGDCKISECQK